MKFEVNAFLPSQEQMLKDLGLDKGGRVQKVIDSEFMRYMKSKMPLDNGIMIANTRNLIPGLITVETPYAHYMNEGIKYVMPHNNKSAYYSPTYGFWSEKGVAKVPSSEPLIYHGGPNRGAHFVERTASENFDDILRAAQKELDRSIR